VGEKILLGKFIIMGGESKDKSGLREEIDD
jgi:hypothetical protein